MGVYMGLFNATITIPQIISGILGTIIASYNFPPIVITTIAGISLVLGALAVYSVKEKASDLV
jgi:maltose/moltooligosaccharide transporter